MAIYKEQYGTMLNYAEQCLVEPKMYYRNSNTEHKNLNALKAKKLKQSSFLRFPSFCTYVEISFSYDKTNTLNFQRKYLLLCMTESRVKGLLFF